MYYFSMEVSNPRGTPISWYPHGLETSMLVEMGKNIEPKSYSQYVVCIYIIILAGGIPTPLKI